MMRIKVECCLTRAEERDFGDVKWMLRNYMEVIRAAMDDGVVDGDELGEVLGDGRIGGEGEREILWRLLEGRQGDGGELT